MTLAPERLLLSHPHLRPCDLAAVFGFDGLKFFLVKIYGHIHIHNKVC